MQIFLGFHYKKQFQEWMTQHRWKAKWGVITEDLSIPNRIKIYSRKKVFTILCFPSSLATREPIVNKCIMIQHGDCNEYLFLTYQHLQSHLIIIIKGNLFIMEDNACPGQPPSLCRPPMDKMFTFKVSNVNLSSPNPPQSNDNPMLKIMVLTVHCLATLCQQGNIPSRSVDSCQPESGNRIHHTHAAAVTLSKYSWFKNSIYLPCSQCEVEHQEQHLDSKGQFSNLATL